MSSTCSSMYIFEDMEQLDASKRSDQLGLSVTDMLAFHISHPHCRPILMNTTPGPPELRDLTSASPKAATHTDNT